MEEALRRFMHNKMDRSERAKQFMPFDPLKGFREALHEKEKIVVKKAELSEDAGELLDRKLHRLAVKDMATVVHFDNGEYVKVTGLVSRIDMTARVLRIVNTKIRFDDILDIVMDGET